MLRKKGKYSITRYAIYSLGFHLFLLVLATVSISIPKKENQLLMDIEIAGEGEFRDIVENNTPAAEIDNEAEPIEEEPPIENTINEKTIPEIIEEPSQIKAEEPQIPQEQQSIGNEIPQEIPEEKIEEPKIEEPKIEEQSAEKIEEEPVTKNIEEKIEEKIEEEPVPKNDEKEKEEIKKEEPKKETKRKKKKRDKKAMMEVIKKAEKETKKKNRRKKMQEIANQAERRRKRNAAFNEMLNNNSKELKQLDNSRKNIVSGRGKKGNGAGSFGTGEGISENDYEMISSQIYPHWVVPSGVRDAENIIIEIKIEVGDNGEVHPSSIKIVDEGRYAKDEVFRAAADSARRAILQASPLSIPREKMNLFREITLRFNLKEALGE